MKNYLLVLCVITLVNCKKIDTDAPVPTPTGSSWELKNNFMGDKRHHPVTFSIGNVGYVGLGSTTATNVYSDFYKYDPNADTWTKLKDFAGGQRAFAYGISHNGKGYVGFGNDLNKTYNDLWEYTPATDTWRQLKACPGEARQHPAMLAINGKIYVGAGNSTKNLKDWWEYDIATNNWTQKTDVPGPARHHPFYFAVNNMAYVGMGHGSDAVEGEIIYKDFYQFNPTTGQWKKIKDLPAMGRVAGTQFDYNGKGYVLSGQGTNHANLPTGEMWEYNPTADEWTKLTPHKGSGRWAPGCFLIGNKVYFTGGTSNSGDEKDLQMFQL